MCFDTPSIIPKKDIFILREYQKDI